MLTFDINSKWNFVHAHYLVSNRQDIRCGIIYVNDPELLAPKSGWRVATYSIQLNLRNSRSTKDNITPYSTINGIKISSLNLDIKITSTKFSNEVFSVTFNITNN